MTGVPAQASPSPGLATTRRATREKEEGGARARVAAAAVEEVVGNGGGGGGGVAEGAAAAAVAAGTAHTAKTTSRTPGPRHAVAGGTRAPAAHSVVPARRRRTLPRARGRDQDQRWSDATGTVHSRQSHHHRHHGQGDQGDLRGWFRPPSSAAAGAPSPRWPVQQCWQGWRPQVSTVGGWGARTGPAGGMRHAGAGRSAAGSRRPHPPTT